MPTYIHTVYGSNSMSFSIVCRRVLGHSVQIWDLLSGRSKAASSPMIVKKDILVESDARYTSH